MDNTKEIKKIVRKVGSSFGIILNKEECKVYNISVGNIIRVIPQENSPEVK